MDIDVESLTCHTEFEGFTEGNTYRVMYQLSDDTICVIDDDHYETLFKLEQKAALEKFFRLNLN